MANVIFSLKPGSSKPTGMIQFGDRMMITFADARPIMLQASQFDNSIKAYEAGIKPPITAPTIADSGDAAANLVYDSELASNNTLSVAYAFYSSKRVTYSRLSPIATHTLPNPAKKLTINGFEAPRDDAFMNDIDTIVVAVQLGQNQGLMCVLPTTQVDCSNYLFTSASLTFDLNDAQLELGFDFTSADDYFSIPPAVKYVTRYGDRLWLGGQRRSIEFGNSGLALTKAQSFRGETVAKITMTGDGEIDDSLLYHSVFIDGQYVGDIADVLSSNVAYLDRDWPVDIASSINFYMAGYNDRIWPTSYHNNTPSNIPIPFPECVRIFDRQILLPVLDRGELIKGLVGSAADYMIVVMSETVQTMTGGLEVGTPYPSLRTEYGRVGAIADRSICVDSSGNAAWIGEEGVIRASTGGIESISHQLGIDRLWKGGRWINPASLVNAVMTYSRQYEGYVIAGLEVYDPVGAAYQTGWWGLLTLKPQLGFWLFNGQKVTSNLIEYPDSDGLGVVLGGDDTSGRVKRMLSPDTLRDATTAGAVADFTWEWREGWQSMGDGQPYAPGHVRLLGITLPKKALTDSTGAAAALTLTFWREDYVQRHEADMATAVTATVDTSGKLLMDIPIPPGSRRYHSLGISGVSTCGAVGTRPIELMRWQTLLRNEQRR